MYIKEFSNYLKNERNFSSKTVVAYLTDVNQFFLFSNKKINTLDSSDLRSWIIFLKDSGLESISINRKISALRSYFKLCNREGFILEKS